MPKSFHQETLQPSPSFTTSRGNNDEKHILANHNILTHYFTKAERLQDYTTQDHWEIEY
jgi:hypothetical protein